MFEISVRNHRDDSVSTRKACNVCVVGFRHTFSSMAGPYHRSLVGCKDIGGDHVCDVCGNPDAAPGTVYKVLANYPGTVAHGVTTDATRPDHVTLEVVDRSRVGLPNCYRHLGRRVERVGTA